MASRFDLAGKRVLVTGASGFTGHYMTAELRTHGCYVIGIGGQPFQQPMEASLAMPDMFCQADLRDLDALIEVMEQTRPDIVIHLAALAFVAHGRAEDFYSINLLGTRNLLQAIEMASLIPECVLVASSANVYGNLSAGSIDEQALPSPANDYAVSKLAMEYVAKLWGGKFPIVVTRPFNYTGVGQAENFLVPKIVSHFARREGRIELGNLDVSRDFGDVRAVVSAYRRLVRSPAAIGKVVNVCSGTAYSLSEVIALCERLTGHTMEVNVNPAFVRPNEVKVLRGENQLLKMLIGDWSCPPLAETLSWMLGVIPPPIS